MKRIIKFSLIGFGLLLGLIAAYILFSDGGYESVVVSRFEESAILQIVPSDDENSNVVIVVDGSSRNYQLKIDLIYYKIDSQEPSQINSEVINIPAGKVRARFVRDFYANRKSGKVVITLTRPKNTFGEVKLSAGIF